MSGRVLLLALLCGAWGAPAQALRSEYTSLDTGRCRLISRHEETGDSEHACAGRAGYSLRVLDGDARMSVNVVAPGGRVHRLGYTSVITSYFSSLGPRAEWRMRGTRPIALIVRVTAQEDPENPERKTSYLAVARITAAAICVTDRIAPSPRANELARRAADTAARRPCLRRSP